MLPQVEAREAAASISCSSSSGTGVEQNLRIERCLKSTLFMDFFFYRFCIKTIQASAGPGECAYFPQK